MEDDEARRIGWVVQTERRSGLERVAIFLKWTGARRDILGYRTAQRISHS